MLIAYALASYWSWEAFTRIGKAFPWGTIPIACPRSIYSIRTSHESSACDRCSWWRGPPSPVLLPSADGPALIGSCFWHSDDLPVAVDHVASDDHPTVLEHQSLRWMYAPNLLTVVLVIPSGIGGSVPLEVHIATREVYVRSNIRIVLRCPALAVLCDHAWYESFVLFDLIVVKNPWENRLRRCHEAAFRGVPDPWILWFPGCHRSMLCRV